MKKIMVIMIALTMLAGMLPGCVAPTKLPDATVAPTVQPDAQATPTPAGLPEAAAEGAAVPVPKSPVEIYIKQKTVTTETEEVALIIINSSDKAYTYDYVQKLERKTDAGAWETVPLTNEAVALALLTIAGGETQEQMFDFANHYEKLTRGTYRIVKTFVDESGAALVVTREFDAL